MIPNPLESVCDSQIRAVKTLRDAMQKFTVSVNGHKDSTTEAGRANISVMPAHADYKWAVDFVNACIKLGDTYALGKTYAGGGRPVTVTIREETQVMVTLQNFKHGGYAGVGEATDEVLKALNLKPTDTNIRLSPAEETKKRAINTILVESTALGRGSEETTMAIMKYLAEPTEI